jgi:hypothetical protein
MTRSLKVYACLTAVLAVLFYLFFQISKHQPALSQVNAFANDPYDAIGSFAVQFALLTALLSLLRAFRPYQPEQALDSQELLLVRGAIFSCLSVMITLIGDAVAMARHPSVWMGLSAGYVLAALVGGMALFTALVGWLLVSWGSKIHSSSATSARIRAICVSVLGLLLLALYPESWRQATYGELFTVVVGATLLFVPTWAVGTAISPSPGTSYEDFLDDVAAVYRWLKLHMGPFAILCNLVESIGNWPPVRSVALWFNPRRHRWNPAILMGLVMGMVLTLGETFGEGGGPHQIGRFVILASVFVSLECFAVLLGYLLLAKLLGLFRPDSGAKSVPGML